MHPAQHHVDASKKRQRDWVEGRARGGKVDRPGALKGGASEDRATQSDSLPPVPHIRSGKFPVADTDAAAESQKNRARGGALRRESGGWADVPDPIMDREAFIRYADSHPLPPPRYAPKPGSADTLDDSPVMKARARGGEIARTPSGGVKASARREAESRGETMPGGKFPIRDAADLANAKHDVGRASDPAAARRWINKRARELGEPPLGG